MNDEKDKTVKESQPAPISSTSPGAGEDLLRAGIMQQPDQPGMLGKIGRFDVIKLLGQGGMGEVLLAREPATNVKVAIKVLKPQLARDNASVHRFLTEARHAYAMGHPNILKVLEVSDSEDRPFYVVPYIEGGSLARRIAPQKPLPTDTALDIARQIASALNYAHGRGIIHRDLKPANVLMDREGHAYLTDFGLLRTVFNDSFVDVQQSALEGTAPYMSPAVVAGKAEDTRCDIYSFGAMLYEMLTGQPPFIGPSVDIILKKVTAGPPEPLLKLNPKASKELAAIADWAMARELRDRYATMADVLSDLERVAKGNEPVGPRGGVGFGRRTRRNLAIAGAALVVVAMATWFWPRTYPTSVDHIASVLNSKVPFVALTKTERTRQEVGHGELGVNRSGHGNPALAKRVCDEFFDAHANSLLEFAVPEGGERFFGMGYTFSSSISMEFIVKADNKIIFRRRLFDEFPQKHVVVDVPIPKGARRLTLVVDALGDNSADWSAWCWPRIYGEGLSPVETQKLSVGAMATVPPAAPAMLPPPPAVPGAAQPGARSVPGRTLRLSSPNPAAVPAPVPMPGAPPAAALPPQPPALSVEDQIARRAFAARAQNLIMNGGFDLGPLGPDGSWRQVLLPGSTQLVGWTVIEKHILRMLDNTGRGVADTNNYFWLQLNGYSAAPPYGGVAQTIATKVGQAYRLTLDLGVWNEPGESSLPNASSVFVSVGSTNVAFTNTLSERGIGVTRTYSFVFVAQAAKTPISIIGTAGRNLIGLDNVSVEPLSDSLPARRPSESPEARLAKVQAMFKGKVTLRPDGRFEFFYDFSDPAQLDDWIIKEPVAVWVVEDGWLVCKKTASQHGTDTRLHHKALYAGKEREISYDAQGSEGLGAGLFAEVDNIGVGHFFHLPQHGGPALLKAGHADPANTYFGALDPKLTYHVVATEKNDSLSFAVDGKEILQMPISPPNVQTGRMAYVKLTSTPGRFDNVRVVGALDPAVKAMTYWQIFLKQADAAYAENRFDEAIKLYDDALAGMEQDQTTDATILKTMKAAAVKHRGLASFIPQRDKLPADKQVEAIHTKLRELNPNYNGMGDFTVRDGKIVKAVVSRLGLTDLSPLKGLPLTWLSCDYNRVQDLSPLQGMPLQALGLKGNPITDLSPLKGMRLTSLEVDSGGVTDLSSLEGMPLKWLFISGNRVRNLSHLRGMSLEHLEVADCGIDDLSPLQGMPLQFLDINGNQITDLSPLRKCPLNRLDAAGNRSRDLSPLKGLPIKILDVPQDVTDLSPLIGMPVVHLTINCPGITDLTLLKDLPLQKLVFKVEYIKTGWEAIRRLPTLKGIDHTGDWRPDQPAAEFWKRFDAGEFTNAVPK